MLTPKPPTEARSLGHPLLDRYLNFVEARTRPNTVLATASDLRVFFGVVDKEPAEVSTQDVLAFIEAQRAPVHDGKLCDWPTVSRASWPRPSSAGCRRCLVSTPTW